MTTVKTYLFAVLFAAVASFSLAAPASATPTEMSFHQSAFPSVAEAVSQAERTDANIKYVQSAISASKAKSIARRAVPGGEVVDISRKGNRYTVRMIRKDGRVVDIVIDARTGRVIN